MLLWFVLFCFPSLHNVFMCIYPICSVPPAKSQVGDLSYAGAAVLLLVPYKTKVTDRARSARTHESCLLAVTVQAQSGQGSLACTSRNKSYLAFW